jgi:hypothetical protein
VLLLETHLALTIVPSFTIGSKIKNRWRIHSRLTFAPFPCSFSLRILERLSEELLSPDRLRLACEHDTRLHHLRGRSGEVTRTRVINEHIDRYSELEDLWQR